MKFDADDRILVEQELSKLKIHTTVSWFTRTESGVYKLSVNANGKIYFASDRNLNSVISKMKNELRNPKNYPTFKTPCYV